MPSFQLPLKKLFIGLLVVLAISLLTLYPSFNLALFGDDWLAFVRYLYHLGPNPELGYVDGKWNHLRYFLTPYGSQDILMGFLYKIYGYNSTLYYTTSYFFRLIAAFSLYPLVSYLTKSRLSAFFAVLFFSVTTIGFDATNWVFNMPSYISIAFFSFFLYFYLRSRKEKKYFLLLPMAAVYYFAHVLAPIRMHGVLPFIFLVELFWMIQDRSMSAIKLSVLRFLTVFLVIAFIGSTGQSNGPPSDLSQRLNEGFVTMKNMLSEGRFDFIFYPLTIFGSLVIPYMSINSSWRILDIPNFLLATTPVFFMFMVLVIFFTHAIENFKKCIKIILPAYLLWWLLVFFIHRGNPATFNHSVFIILLTVGGYSLITVGSLLLIYYKKFISTTLFIALAWTFASFFAPWWYHPTFEIDFILTPHRYLIVSAVGISILLSSIISLGKDKQKTISLFAVMCLILILHIFATRIYLKGLLSSHGQEISNKIWASFPYIPEIGKGNQPRIFYFQYDASNFNIVHDVITFGFPPHIGLMYKYYTHYSPSNNAAVSESREVISAVTDGESLKAHGWVQKGPIDVDHIYAFRLEGQDNLINITDLVREQLTQIVKDYRLKNP